MKAKDFVSDTSVFFFNSRDVRLVYLYVKLLEHFTKTARKKEVSLNLRNRVITYAAALLSLAGS